MIVAGIDISLTATGVAVIIGDKVKLHTVGSKPCGPALGARANRLTGMAKEILACTSEADLIVIESPAYSSRSGQMHERSGLWWLVVTQLKAWNVPVIEFTPTALKKHVTGKGTSSKLEVAMAMQRKHPGLRFAGDDEADALALAEMGQLARPSVLPAA